MCFSNKEINTSPKISVIITTYNRSELLKKAIDSVSYQTYKNYELHVVDDASTDDTKRILDVLIRGKKDVFYWRNRINQGLAAARNTGIRHSNGKYITFLDDDDIWLPERLQIQVEAAEIAKSEYGVFYCGSARYLADGRLVEAIPWLRGDLMEALLKGWTPPCSASFFRKDALEAIGGFDTNIRSGVDHDIWFALAAADYKYDYVHRGLVITNPEQHALERITTNYTARIKGIEILCRKWQQEIERCAGHAMFEKFRSRYLAREFYAMAFKGIQSRKISYRETVKLLMKSLKHYPNNITTWLLLVIQIIGGHKGVELIQIFRDRLGSINSTKDTQYQKQKLGISGLC